MLGFIKECFLAGLAFLSTLTSVNLLNCISMNNQECKVRPQIVNVNSDEPVFYPFSIKTSKCSGSCNNINNPCAKICVPDVVKLERQSIQSNVKNWWNKTHKMAWNV